MIDLRKISEIYNGELCLFPEKGFIDGIILIQDWEKLTDEEKIKYRKNKLEYYLTHFNETETEKLKNKYKESVISVSVLILEFLKGYEIINFDEIKNDFLQRIYIMLFCELININKYFSFNFINHIPFQIYEPILDQINDSEMYYKYNIENLFIEYKKMLLLFDQI